MVHVNVGQKPNKIGTGSLLLNSQLLTITTLPINNSKSVRGTFTIRITPFTETQFPLLSSEIQKSFSLPFSKFLPKTLLKHTQRFNFSRIHPSPILRQSFLHSSSKQRPQVSLQ
ncbi:hypothetical protein ES332_A11G384200v1 [Gossypium tomentosum]|uniref:Uncharacterized protein n=1 Tax=Gossypium tomentosum TaxID=34277 RepID=A0A5D2NM21_GOSTO|nr:hypothetical protein ES332_A11G384200v1 [Gossypium tomentosum]TYI04005.1 hypothetical protein ES332_A11G384200v1 [Gossypium tomentosum]